MTIL
jgi:hypothetical protein